MNPTETKQIRRSFDVDVDVASNTDRSSIGTRAIVYNEDTKRVLPHPSGVYLETVPIDNLTGNAAFDYKDGDAVGFYKVDILTNTVYDSFSSKEDLLLSAEKEPDWSLLQKPSVVDKLPHLSKHVEFVSEMKPTSVMELADCLALIRPGKIHLIDDYREDKERTRKRLYARPKHGVYFKKSHAVSYAVMIVAVLNKIHDSGITW